MIILKGIYNLFLFTCILLMVTNCNQTNTKQIVENVKNFDQKPNVKNSEEQRILQRII